MLRLKVNLASKEIKLVNAEIGRLDSSPLWVVTFISPNHHVQTVRALIKHSHNVFSTDIADDISRRISNYLESN